jgi:uncharacterized protein with HEPN domain
MPREVAQYLYDVQQACDLLAQFAAGMTVRDYLADPLLRSGIERQLMILGEALSQATRLRPDLSSRITGYRQIIDFRNILVHAYFNLDADVVWGVLENDLALLKRETDQLLAEISPA